MDTLDQRAIADDMIAEQTTGQRLLVEKGRASKLARSTIKEQAVNTTLIQGKQLAEFDGIVLDTINRIPPKSHHPAEKRLRIGIQNEQGDVYRVIKIYGLMNFLDLIGKFRDLGFTDEFAEQSGDKQGFDAVISGRQKS